MKRLFLIALLLLPLALCTSVTTRVVDFSRVDLIVNENVYPEITAIHICEGQECKAVDNFTAKNHVILLGNGNELAQNRSLNIYVDLYSPDGSVVRSTMIVARLPEEETSGYTFMEMNVPLFYVWLGFLGSFVISGVIIYFSPFKKKPRILSEYVFQQEK